MTYNEAEVLKIIETARQCGTEVPNDELKEWKDNLVRMIATTN